MTEPDENRKSSFWSEKFRQPAFACAIVAIVSLLLFLWLAREVSENRAVVFDEIVRRAIHGSTTPRLTDFIFFMTRLGAGIFLAAATFVAAIVFILLKQNRAAVILLLTMAGEFLLEFSLKILFQLVRPEPFFEYPPLKTFSFPSGHALGSFCLFMTLAWLVSSRLAHRRSKIVVWIFASALVLLVGLSRVYLGVHFPSDVLGGFLAGSVWISIVALVDSRLRRKTGAN